MGRQGFVPPSLRGPHHTYVWGMVNLIAKVAAGVLVGVLVLVVYAQRATITSQEARLTNLETAANPEERWVCAQTARQRVVVVFDITGAASAHMDICVEWKAK